MRLGSRLVISICAAMCMGVSPAADAQGLKAQDKNLLQAISKKESEKALRLLRTGGANASVIDPTGRTALMNAAAAGLVDVVREILDRGADINVKSKEGQTALMLAVDFGQLETVRMLLTKGADLKAKDQDEWTALQYATMRVDGSTDEKKKTYEEIVRLLKEADKPPTANAAANGPAPR
jgi:ankyrin repeat protein